jgi:hypothetical protein
MKTYLSILIFIAHCCAACASGDTLTTDTTTAHSDSLQTVTVLQNDSLSPPVAMDTITVPSSDSLSVVDTAVQITNKDLSPSILKIRLVKRKYNYRQQVALAVGMMIFIALAMMSAQTWNPQ